MDRCSIRVIARFWSREHVPPKTEDELLAALLCSYWRGDFDGDAVDGVELTPLPRRKMLEIWSGQRKRMANPLLLTPEEPEPTFVVDVGWIESRPLILRLPEKVEAWTDEQLATACQVLGQDAEEVVNGERLDLLSS